MGKRFRRTPSFFKIMFEDFENGLRLPPAFVEKFRGFLSKIRRLKISNGRSWLVELKEVGDDLFLCSGWNKFVKDKSVAFGDLLLFRLVNNTTFSVVIYGKTGCEKDLASRNVEEDLTIVGKKPTRFTSLFHRKWRKKFAGSRRTCHGLSSTVNRKKPYLQASNRSLTTEDEQALERAREFMSESDYPCFRIMLRPSHVYHLVPYRFVNEYMPKKSLAARILDSNSRTWKLWYNYAAGRATICKGWNPLVSNHKLAEGDVCVFELIDDKDVTLKLSIFRD